MTHTIIMPDLGQTTSEGRVLKWLKSPGDKVMRGEVLLEVETDKATMEVEAYAEGYVRELLVNEGEMAAAMSPIAILTDTLGESYECPGDKVPSTSTRVGSSRDVPPPAPVDRTLVVAAPAARSLAKELGIDLRLITGTGPGGLITRADVERYSAECPVAETKPTAGMAALTTKSKQTIPHFYVTVDVDVSAAVQWRRNWNLAYPDLRVSMNDVFVRAASKALRDVPRLNVSYNHGKLEQKSVADVLLVVAVESGLMLVPIASPDLFAWDEYLRAMKSCLQKIRQGRVTETSSSGIPSLAISNLGMFGVKEFAAIIPPACAAVLAIGAVREQPIVDNNQIVVGKVCSLTLSVDHRMIDGIVAANFLGRMQVHLNSL